MIFEKTHSIELWYSSLFRGTKTTIFSELLSSLDPQVVPIYFGVIICIFCKSVLTSTL